MSNIPRLENVALSFKDGVALIKYNRPKAANALNVPLITDVLTALRWADGEDQVKVILQTGEGRLFTAGLDLVDESVGKPDTVLSDEFADAIGEVHKTMINTDKVLVTAVTGAAPGWGTTSLALADLVYASPEALFFTPFVQLGICAEACSSLTLARIMGHQKAAALLLAGERMTATELERAGLVTKVLPLDNFLDTVLATCYRVARSPPGALRFNKNLLMRASRRELLEVNEVEMKALRERARGQEARTAVGEFLREQDRKRKGKGKGKSEVKL